jgi:hypothetical protein
MTASLGDRLRRPFRSVFGSDLRASEERLVAAQARRLHDGNPQTKLSWIHALLPELGGSGIAILTNERFIFYAPPARQEKSVTLELNVVREVHLRPASVWRLYIHVRTADGTWLRFLVTSFGAWQRAFRRAELEAGFQLRIS